jgi:hypothetical protein
MASEIFHPWRGNPRLIEIRYFETLDTEDISETLEALRPILDQAMLAINLVFNFLEVTHYDTTLLNDFCQHPVFNHSQIGHCIFVTEDTFVLFTAQAFGHRTGLPMKHTKTPDQAWEFFSELGLC